MMRQRYTLVLYLCIMTTKHEHEAQRHPALLGLTLVNINNGWFSLSKPTPSIINPVWPCFMPLPARMDNKVARSYSKEWTTTPE